MAKPIVSTDVGDVALYVEEGQAGFVVPVGDSDALANRTAKLVHDEELRIRLGREARQVAVRKLDIEQCAQRHLDAYKQMVARA